MNFHGRPSCVPVKNDKICNYISAQTWSLKVFCTSTVRDHNVREENHRKSEDDAVTSKFVYSYSLINALSALGISLFSDTYRSTFMCKSYFSRSSVIFSIIGEAWWKSMDCWSFQLSIKSTVSLSSIGKKYSYRIFPSSERISRTIPLEIISSANFLAFPCVPL